MSLALARKYRPSTFDTLIGQESVSQTLCLALDSDRLSHAYLFSGLRGSGKTSTARIFAKALICEKGTTSHPCGTCVHCSMANSNSHLDIIEMDAASNRGIDDIKDLIEHTKYKPSSARYKIFIIDEVHMLTPQAFNALLKTLEEPPSFVKFILATTDPLKLPATILSRTQHFRFKKIPQNLVLMHLEYILEQENIGYEKEAIEIVARSGAGSLRDSLTLLDQAIVYSKNFVDINTITDMLGIIEPTHLEKLLNDIMQYNSANILEFIKMAKDYEAEMILDELTLYLKELLLSGDMNLTYNVIEKFFKIIAESKYLLSIGSDGEFVLLLSLFKMMKSSEIKIVEQKIPVTSISKIVTPIQKDSVKIEKIVEVKDTDFNELISKINENNMELGICFNRNISFDSFKDNKLTWNSTAEGSDKKILINNWGLINMFVKEIFGFETKIVNISKKKSNEAVATQPKKIEEEMKISSIAPDAGDRESAKEKEPSNILDEPMVAEALALLDPKKVRIKRNS